MTSTPPEARDESQTFAERAQTFLDWTKVNTKALTIGAIVVVVAGAAFWFYTRSRELQAANAERALMAAQQAVGSGNLALAQSDLDKVATRYSSTTAGVEASLLLAQVDYNQKMYQDGISALQRIAGSSAAGPYLPTIKSLMGDGYMELGKPSDAAKQYEAAASAASQLPNEHAFHSSKAARAYAAAGDTAKARQLWASLEADTSAAGLLQSEAKIRLGELTARVAKK
jgi:predicted negative regulator of RcsB-dependent stress response